VRQAIKAAGARLLFLPKYSPDLNPIEPVFAKLKAHRGKAAPRTLDAVADAIAKARAQISPDECANYLKGAGQALRLNPKTIAKWRSRKSVANLRTGRKEFPRLTVLTVEEEKVVVAFRRHTLLPLDDCLASETLVASSLP
jgi:hypothetical protein